MEIVAQQESLPLGPTGMTGVHTRSTLWRWALKYRILLLATGHLLVFAASYWLSFGLRFDFHIPPQMLGRMLTSLPVIAVVKLVVFFFMGHYHGWWRYVTFSDLASLLKATVLSMLVMVLLNHYAFEGQLPRVVVILDGLVTATILGALRASWRLGREYQWLGKDPRRPTLMIGANDQNGVFAHQIHSHSNIPYRIVGFVDRDAARIGTHLGGIPVLGELASLREVATSCRVKDVLVQADALQGDTLRELMDTCEAADIELKVVPSFADQLRCDEKLPIRDVEINDLLQREPIQLDMESISKDIRNRVVVVTGSGGSIGSEICRQLLQFQPRDLILVDNGENSLFLIHQELSNSEYNCNLHPYVADVRDDSRMRQIFEKWRPDFVFHAAAHKHVGLMESNVAQCVQNNVYGSKCVADLAHEYQADKFVLISTDKAVNPTSVMGATKQIAERYVNSLDGDSNTAFIVVRFGNVLGSNGSVVPIFREQIRQGGPITITDFRMTRFFMTIPEASQLVLQASSMGQGGEIFVLEMGEQIPIVDLAKDLVRLSGLPSDAIEIRHIGIRPGEKLYEELYCDEEKCLTTSHPKVRAAYQRPYSPDEVRDSIANLLDAANGDDGNVRRMLKTLVPEYVPYSQPYLAADPELDPSTANGVVS